MSTATCYVAPFLPLASRLVLNPPHPSGTEPEAQKHSVNEHHLLRMSPSDNALLEAPHSSPIPILHHQFVEAEGGRKVCKNSQLVSGMGKLVNW